MKKNILNICLSLFVASLCGGAFSSCSDDDNGESYGTLGVDNATITLLSNAVSDSLVSLTSPTDWKAASSDSWLTLVSGTTGYGVAGNNITVRFNATENTSTEERTGTIVFTSLTDRTQTVTVKVVQPGHQINQYSDTNSSAPIGMQSNASMLMKQMYMGWNLGNTMESSGADETSWGNPMTTQAMVDGLKAQGFNTIRIPVRWYVHADDDMNIEAAWLARVKEVVDYAYNQGMYVILNSHHDNWYDRVVLGTLGDTDDSGITNKQHIMTKFTNMWTQIANTFKDYDEHLLFSGTNEVIYMSQGQEVWTLPTDESQKDTLFAYMDTLNQTFVNAVRATGGNNAWRTLIVQPVAASPNNAIEHFTKPTDTVADRLMLEFHFYQPYSFCQQQGDDSKGENKYYWGKDYVDLDYAVTKADDTTSAYPTTTEEGVSKLFARLKYQFVDNGLPCIMGEYGAVKHMKTSANQNLGINYTKSEASRAYYFEYVVKEAKNYGFASLIWDNNVIDAAGENMGILDRSNGMQPYSAEALTAIIAGASEGTYPY